MQEREVTVGQETYPLPDPFFVIATQNPIEQEGTYPLPEAQLDRFMFNIFVDYPSAGRGGADPRRDHRRRSGRAGRWCFNARQILNMQKLVAQRAGQRVRDPVRGAAGAGDPARRTRPRRTSSSKMVDWGAGPRAGQYLILGGKAFAAMDGRYTVSTEDIRQVAVPVLRHRIGCNFAAQSEGVDSVEIVQRLLEAVPEPEVPKYGGRRSAASSKAKTRASVLTWRGT